MVKRKGRRFLVAVDFSPDSLAALERAIELARTFGGEVEAVHVLELGELEGTKKDAPARKVIEALHQKAQSNLRNLALDADPEKQWVRAAEVSRGRPADVILEHAAAREVDVIVMGTRGRTGLERLLSGSVAERVVRLAPCDVLVVKPRRA